MHEQTEPPKLRLQHGPIEIERKFLVATDAWRRSAVRSVEAQRTTHRLPAFRDSG
jgi:hypothetical protein